MEKYFVAKCGNCGAEIAISEKTLEEMKLSRVNPFANLRLMICDCGNNVANHDFTEMP
jgi:hypothetical protein